MIQVFKTDEQYVKWLNGQTLPSGIVVYVSDDETMYFSTNNIKGELKTYKCEKEEPIIYPPLIYSAKSAGSKLTVNGQSVTLEQGDNITLDYPNEITSVKATDNKALTYIKIPNTVTRINEYDFRYCSALASITIPETVTSIGSYAFRDCSALGSITIPETVTSIGIGAFYKCSVLASITIPSGVTSIGDYTFDGCSSLGSITIPETVTSIGVCAFRDCAALGSITIPSGVTSIGNWAFYNCAALASITIPSGVTSIGDSAFYNCAALTDFRYNGTMSQWSSITLGTDWKLNAPFTVVHCTDGDVSLEEPIQPIQPNNLVYSAKYTGSTIMVNGENVTLEQGDNIVLDYPSEITSVLGVKNKALTYIQIPNTVTSIDSRYGQGAFYDCTSLTSVTLPDSLTSIGDSAFYNCAALTDFRYNGTMSQWSSITLGTDWNKDAAFTVVHCTDGNVAL